VSCEVGGVKGCGRCGSELLNLQLSSGATKNK